MGINETSRRHDYGDMPIIPLYYYTKVKGAKPEVKGVRVSALGHVFFDKAYIEGEE